MTTILANPADLADTAARYRTFAPQVDDVLRRVLNAGAEAPLTFIGLGGSAAVFCDRRGVGWKVARDVALRGMLREEAGWLETASSVPWVRDRVARFGRWHEGPAAIERECVRPAAGRGPRNDDGRLFGLHTELGRLMGAYGWGAPEFKEDSYVMKRDRGPVLVDASGAVRVGHQLLREVAGACRGAGASSFECENARWSLRMEYDRSVPEGIGRRMHDRLAAGPTHANGARLAVSPPMFATLQKIEERGHVSRTNPGGGTEVGGDQFHTATIVALRERGLIRVEQVGTRKTETEHGRGQMRYVSTVWDEPIIKAWVTQKGVDVLRARGVDAGDAIPPGATFETHANPARAARPYREGTTYHPGHATLTEGHFELPEVRRAAEVASWVTNQSWRPRDAPWGKANYLGQGNFGVAWEAESPEGETFVVKLPAAHDIHWRAWPRDSQRENLVHEAGVANELEARHPGLVPRTVYTEFMGGTPAIVREYGEPVASITPEEYGALERELLDVEREEGWRVGNDDVILYRRPDGSLFIGDVGFWRAPTPGGAPWDVQNTALDGELGVMQRRYLASLPVDEDAVASPGEEWRRRRGFTTLAMMVAAVDGVRREHATLAKDPDLVWPTWSRLLLRSIRDRAAAGLRELPPEVAEVVPLAEAVDRAAPPEDESWRARRRRRPG